MLSGMGNSFLWLGHGMSFFADIAFGIIIIAKSKKNVKAEGEKDDSSIAFV
jgi:hypothetical protein